MSIFYDIRVENGKKFLFNKDHPLKGYILFKWKIRQMLWIKNHGIVVTHIYDDCYSKYLFGWYIPENIIDAFLYLFNKKELISIKK